MKIEQTPQGLIEISYAETSILFSRGQLYEIFEWAYEHQDWLRGKHDEPHAPFETCGCSSCRYIREVLESK